MHTPEPPLRRRTRGGVYIRTHRTEAGALLYLPEVPAWERHWMDLELRRLPERPQPSSWSPAND